MNNIKNNFIVIVLFLVLVFSCKIVKLDKDGKPIIPVSASYKSLIENKAPEEIAEDIWENIEKEATTKFYSLDTLSVADLNDKSVFIYLSGTITKIDKVTSHGTMSVNAENSLYELQIGPIVRGNAIRDAFSGITFDLFKNQVQFAKLSKVLNMKAIDGVSNIDSSWINADVEIYAAATIKNNTLERIIPLKITRR